MISTSERHAEHPFAGQNTQHIETRQIQYIACFYTTGHKTFIFLVCVDSCIDLNRHIKRDPTSK